MDKKIIDSEEAVEYKKRREMIEKLRKKFIEENRIGFNCSKWQDENIRKQLEQVHNQSIPDYEYDLLYGCYFGETFLAALDSMLAQADEDIEWKAIKPNAETSINKGNYAFGIAKKLEDGTSIRQVLQFYRPQTNERYKISITKSPTHFPKESDNKYAEERRENQFVSLKTLVEMLDITTDCKEMPQVLLQILEKDKTRE